MLVVEANETYREDSMGFFSSRMPERLREWVLTQCVGAGILSSSIGSVLNIYFSLPPQVVALCLFIAAFEAAVLMKFRGKAAAGFGCGCAAVAFSASLAPNADGSLTGAQGISTLLGFLLILRFYSEGPEPNGWTKETLSK